jgi:hypothetical protein
MDLHDYLDVAEKKEMEYLLQLCGFEVIRVYGDYCKNEPKYPGHIIWVARKR